MNRVRQILKFLQNRASKVETRIRFVFSTILLTILMAIATFFTFEYALIFLSVFLLLNYLLCYFALLEGIEDIEWFTLFLMPLALTIAFYLFYFLFPVRWLTRLPFIVMYGISTYAVLLCANIFNVGVEKSIQLYRAAFSVNFLYQMVISFLLFNALLSFKMNFFLNALLVGVIGFLLSFQLIWSVKLELKVERATLIFSLLIALILAEVALLGSFMPLKSTIFALFLTSSYYSLSGLIHSFLDQRLFKETIREYVVVWIAVIVITILSLRW